MKIFLSPMKVNVFKGNSSIFPILNLVFSFNTFGRGNRNIPNKAMNKAERMEPMVTFSINNLLVIIFWLDIDVFNSKNIESRDLQ